MEKQEANSRFTTSEILGFFPMLNEEDWAESPLHRRTYVSIWNYWLIDKGHQALLADAKPEEEQAWQAKFRKLHEKILANTTAYSCEYKDSGWSINSFDSRESFLEEVDSGCMLLLPELLMIYFASTDFTSLLFYQQREGMQLFDQWVENSGLKYIGDGS